MTAIWNIIAVYEQDLNRLDDRYWWTILLIFAEIDHSEILMDDTKANSNMSLLWTK